MQTRWLYVYYKISEPELESYCRHAATLFARLRDVAAFAPQQNAPQLLRRPETKQGVVTLMEVYGPMTEPELNDLAEALNKLRSEMNCYASLTLSCEYFDELPCA